MTNMLTLTYSTDAKGWTSFHSYKPDWMMKVNNRFFSVKDGQLYLHNDQTNALRNNFYGNQFDSKMVTLINVENSEDKIFKTLVLEGNVPWDATVKSNLNNSTIDSSEFNQRESRHFAHVRRSENEEDLHGNAAIGLGYIQSVAGLAFTFSFVSNLVNIGDDLFQMINNVKVEIGTITAINNQVITLGAIVNAHNMNSFSFVAKDSRIEGGGIRGYYAEITLVNSNTSSVELFAIESNIIKSYV